MNTVKKQPALTQREKTFLRVLAEKGNLTEAGRTAGYPEKSLISACTELLARASAQRYLEEYRASLNIVGREAVRAALRRIAFGQNNDAVSLAVSERELSPEEISALDLFGISELKQIKGGGLEMKFTSRLDALKLLYELEQGEGNGNALQSFWSEATAAAEEFQLGDGEDGYAY